MQTQELLDRMDDAARRARFSAEPIGLIGEFKIKAYVRIVDPDAPHIYISAGVHGDEPAGPLAILRLLRNNGFPAKTNLFLVPVVNPRGLNDKTRTNPEGIDINRDYGPDPKSPEAKAHLKWLGKQQFHLALCLHEDSEGEGFYLYELFHGDTHPQLVEPTFAQVRRILPIDTRELIDDMPAVNGIMQPPIDSFRRSRTHLPEALQLHFNHSQLCYTFETPSRLSIPSRVDAQVIAIHSIIDAFLQKFETAPLT